jgi:uncharacterized Fe-S radical SAM superfamily protein PflX
MNLSVAELERRAVEAFELLGPRCVVCPRGCKIDRRADAQGLCAIEAPRRRRLVLPDRGSVGPLEERPS